MGNIIEYRKEEEDIEKLRGITSKVWGLDVAFDLLDLYPEFERGKLSRGIIKFGNPALATSTCLHHLIVDVDNQVAAFLIDLRHGHCAGRENTRTIGFYCGKEKRSGFKSYSYGSLNSCGDLHSYSAISKLQEFGIDDSSIQVTVRYEHNYDPVHVILDFCRESGKISDKEIRKNQK